MKIGSLCTGYGGLDMAVEAHFNAKTLWCSEIDPYASQLIKERMNIPNYGDLKKIDWEHVPNVDILTAGYPCQPFSTAGNRKGTNDERHLWPYIKDAISILAPRFVVLENVRGHLSLGFKEVLKDLAELGYDAQWQVVRASDIGAPHQRARLFVIAYPYSVDWRVSPSTEAVANSTSGWAGRQSIRDEKTNAGSSSNCEYGIYNRQVPDILAEDGKLNPVYVEYMMGLPKGWVTDLCLSRTQKLKMLGNGVVPQQAYYALKTICDPIHIPHSEIIGDATHE
jgi:DNA (cytosine-5)-methyltransferase 1